MQAPGAPAAAAAAAGRGKAGRGAQRARAGAGGGGGRAARARPTYPAPQAHPREGRGGRRGSAGVGPNRGGLQSRRPRRPGWEESAAAGEHRAAVSARAPGARPPRRPGGSVSAAARAGPSGGPSLTLRRDLLRRRGRGLQRPQAGHAEGGRERLRRGAEQAAVRVPRPEALPPGRRAPEHLVLALHATRGDPHSLPARGPPRPLLGVPLPARAKAGAKVTSPVGPCLSLCRRIGLKETTPRGPCRLCDARSPGGMGSPLVRPVTTLQHPAQPRHLNLGGGAH